MTPKTKGSPSIPARLHPLKNTGNFKDGKKFVPEQKSRLRLLYFASCMSLLYGYWIPPFAMEEELHAVSPPAYGISPLGLHVQSNNRLRGSHRGHRHCFKLGAEENRSGHRRYHKEWLGAVAPSTWCIQFSRRVAIKNNLNASATTIRIVPPRFQVRLELLQRESLCGNSRSRGAHCVDRQLPFLSTGGRRGPTTARTTLGFNQNAGALAFLDSSIRPSGVVTPEHFHKVVYGVNPILATRFHAQRFTWGGKSWGTDKTMHPIRFRVLLRTDFVVPICQK